MSLNIGSSTARLALNIESSISSLEALSTGDRSEWQENQKLVGLGFLVWHTERVGGENGASHPIRD